MERSFRKYVFIIFLAMILLLIGCRDEQGIGNLLNQRDQDDASDVTEENPSDPKGTNGKTLIWYVDQTTVGDENIYRRFNEILHENGADYGVEFVGVNLSNPIEYYEHLIDMKENQRQVDLLNTGFGRMIEVPDEKEMVMLYTNVEAVKNNILEPLDDFLETQLGDQLYQQFDEKIWERHKIDQTIYGVSNAQDIYSPTTIYINDDIAKKYDIELPQEIEGFKQLEEIIKQTNLDEENIVPLASSGTYMRYYTGFDFFDNGIAATYDDEGIPFALNPFEDPEVLAMIQTLSTLSAENYLESYHRSYNKVDNGDFFALLWNSSLHHHGGKYYLASGQPVEVTSYQVNNDFIVSLKNTINGIASWSDYKEEAFDLLVRLNTDPELSNLLYYGIEGEHYELEDSFAIPLDHDKRVPGYFSPANFSITHSTVREPENKDEFLRNILSSAELSPLVGFELDPTEIEEELAAITSIYNEYESLWTVQERGVDDQLEAVNQALYDAGIDDVLEEINSQFRSWWEEKG